MYYLGLCGIRNSLYGINAYNIFNQSLGQGGAMKRYCDICNAELRKGVNINTLKSKRCVIINDKNTLSECQKAKNKETAKAAKIRFNYRTLYKPLKRHNYDEKMRECLKCNNFFLSEGPFNRLCNACARDNHLVGVKTGRISGINNQMSGVYSRRIYSEGLQG